MEEVPVTSMASEFPLTDRVTPAFTVPVPEESVWAVEELELMVNPARKKVPRPARVSRREKSKGFLKRFIGWGIGMLMLWWS